MVNWICQALTFPLLLTPEIAYPAGFFIPVLTPGKVAAGDSGDY